MCLYASFCVDGSCHSALFTLRSVREERRGLFGGRRQSSRARSTSASWTHKFFCLHSSDADRVPTAQWERLLLEEAGLGEKVVTVPDVDCSPATFQRLLLEAYPRLEEGGGFELLRCLPKSRDLTMITPRIASSPR